MNCYTYQELSVGQTESFTVSLTEQMVRDFGSLTGDQNPLHTDPQYAREKGHPEMVVYGMMTASFLSTLAGMYLPGKYSLIHSVEVKFAKPVYLSMGALTVSGEIVEKNDMFHIIKVKVRITDSAGTAVCRGIMRIGVEDGKE